MRPALEKVARRDRSARTRRERGAARPSPNSSPHASLTRSRCRGRSGTPRSLSQFLLEDRRGHCEYFATATVLLLRMRAFPRAMQPAMRSRNGARWSSNTSCANGMRTRGHWPGSTGAGRSWIPRRRCGQRRNRTPPRSLQPLYDLLSLFNYRLVALAAQRPADGSAKASTMLLVAAALTLYLAWRIWRRRRVRVPVRALACQRVAPRLAAIPHVASCCTRRLGLGYPRPPGAPLLALDSESCRWRTREISALLEERDTQLLPDALRSGRMRRRDEQRNVR